MDEFIKSIDKYIIARREEFKNLPPERYSISGLLDEKKGYIYSLKRIIPDSKEFDKMYNKVFGK